MSCCRLNKKTHSHEAPCVHRHLPRHRGHTEEESSAMTGTVFCYWTSTTVNVFCLCPLVCVYVCVQAHGGKLHYNLTAAAAAWWWFHINAFTFYEKFASSHTARACKFCRIIWRYQEPKTPEGKTVGEMS